MKLLGNPKTLIILVLVVLGVSVLGGAVGNAFGFGFLGSPIAHIQLPAEPAMPEPLFGNFYITNTMVATWLAIIVLCGLSFLATRNASEVPGRMQGMFEMIIEFFLDLAESIGGHANARRFFPLVMTIFLFVVTANWMGILPGFGSIGWVEEPDRVIHHAEERAEAKGEHVDLESVDLQVFSGTGGLAVLGLGTIDNHMTAAEFEHEPNHGLEEGERAGLLVPFFRSANTDINTTLALSLVAMFMVHFWALRSLGTFGHVGKYLNFKEGPVMLFVGLLEIVGELARVISFTFRLFGNIFAGEVLLIAMGFLLPLVGIIPFLGLELFVGVIQAFIFAMLTLVFAATAAQPHEGHEGEHH